MSGLLIYGFVFGLGLSAGSFVNALVFRLEKGRTLLGRSSCPQCTHELSWTDLIPLVSYLFLQGKCRYCKAKISWQYPLVELATALLFVIFVSVLPRLGLGMENLTEFSFSQVAGTGVLFGIAALLVAIFLYDLKRMLIPDALLYPAIGLAFAWQALPWLSQGVDNLPKASFLGVLLAGAGAAFFFFVIYALSKGRAMGFGDVKLAFFMGIFLGFPAILPALWIAVALGAVLGMGLVLARKKRMGSEIPFGPFLIVGTLLAFLWGGELMNWYLQLVML